MIISLTQYILLAEGIAVPHLNSSLQLLKEKNYHTQSSPKNPHYNNSKLGLKWISLTLDTNTVLLYIA